MDHLERQICDYISSELLSDGRSVEPSDDLLMTGLVDSMGMMWLLSFIEDQLKISVPAQDVTLENFRSVDAMSRYLSTRIAD